MKNPFYIRKFAGYATNCYTGITCKYYKVYSLHRYYQLVFRWHRIYRPELVAKIDTTVVVISAVAGIAVGVVFWKGILF